jgi:hypothetical protein
MHRLSPGPLRGPGLFILIHRLEAAEDWSAPKKDPANLSAPRRRPLDLLKLTRAMLSPLVSMRRPSFGRKSFVVYGSLRGAAEWPDTFSGECLF